MLRASDSLGFALEKERKSMPFSIASVRSLLYQAPKTFALLPAAFVS